jgi:hypothetical protein
MSCKDEKGPDVSDIKAKLETERFERDFFTMDTNNLSASLDRLYNTYPTFFRDFTQHILGIPPSNDSGMAMMKAIRQFLHDYRPVYDSAQKIFPDMKTQEREIIKGLKYVKHYFPSYAVPGKLITFIGPMDAYFEGSILPTFPGNFHLNTYP